MEVEGRKQARTARCLGACFRSTQARDASVQFLFCFCYRLLELKLQRKMAIRSSRGRFPLDHLRENTMVAGWIKEAELTMKNTIVLGLAKF